MHPLVVVQYHALRCSGRNRQFAVLRYVDKEDVMRQKHILTTLAIFAVIGAVSVPNSLAGAWRLDVSDRHVVDRGGLEWNPVIYTQLSSGVPSDVQLKAYNYIWPFQKQDSQFGISPSNGSGYGMENKSGSSSNEGRYGPNSSEKELSGASKSPSGGSGYGGIPTLPSADPMLEELSRAPR